MACLYRHKAQSGHLLYSWTLPPSNALKACSFALLLASLLIIIIRSPTSPRPRPLAQPHKDTYSHARKNPFSDVFDVARSVSDIGHRPQQEAELDVFDQFSPNEKPFDRIRPKEKHSSFSIKNPPFEYSSK